MKYRNANIQSIEEAMKRLIDGEDLRVSEGHNKIIFDISRLPESPFRVVGMRHNYNVPAHMGILQSFAGWQTPIDPLKESIPENPVLAYRWNGDRPEYPDASLLYYNPVVGQERRYTDMDGFPYKNAELVPVQDCAEWEGGDE